MLSAEDLCYLYYRPFHAICQENLNCKNAPLGKTRRFLMLNNQQPQLLQPLLQLSQLLHPQLPPTAKRMMRMRMIIHQYPPKHDEQFIRMSPLRSIKAIVLLIVQCIQASEMCYSLCFSNCPTGISLKCRFCIRSVVQFCTANRRRRMNNEEKTVKA